MSDTLRLKPQRNRSPSHNLPREPSKPRKTAGLTPIPKGSGYLYAARRYCCAAWIEFMEEPA